MKFVCIESLNNFHNETKKHPPSQISKYHPINYRKDKNRYGCDDKKREEDSISKKTNQMLINILPFI